MATRFPKLVKTERIPIRGQQGIGRSPLDAWNTVFRREGIDAPNPDIILVFKGDIDDPQQVNSQGCKTTYTGTAGNARTVIICGDQNILTQFTVVHELGHVFANRSLQSIEGESSPLSLRTRVARADLVDCNGGLIIIPEDSTFDRGARGWGTGPATTTTGLKLITDFQQNPTNNADEGPAEEAAADMFLNWVYRQRTDQTAPAAPCGQPHNHGIWSGFLNRDWRDIQSDAPTAGSPDDSLPGDKRYVWVNDQILDIFETRGW